ncbi:hypothetical protein CAEBREN_15073 [Caenorhabditis brenneri]|uniref:Ubiquitin-like domain-containing protein n=1 Tax=Caenorhabditis brenneri TaxID=135651 RepID=G0NDX1_CAEBE|nr:hypothetical protein CAEBREN_15073 [Caenorhabditis brenneri]
MSGGKNNTDQASFGASSGRKMRKKATTDQTATEDHNNTEDFQQEILGALRQIQQEIAFSKQETLDSQQQFAQDIIRRVEKVEEVSALRALATENEADRYLIKHLQGQLKEANEKQEKQDQKCPNINITVRTVTGQEIPLKVESLDVVYVLKLRIKELEDIPLHNMRLIFQSWFFKQSATIKMSSQIAISKQIRALPNMVLSAFKACELSKLKLNIKE